MFSKNVNDSLENSRRLESVAENEKNHSLLQLFTEESSNFQKIEDIKKFLFACNADVNYTNDDGQTLLHIYFANKEENYHENFDLEKIKVCNFIRFLLDMGASLDATDKTGKTPVHVAAENNTLIKLIEPMLEFFNNVTACDEEGETVLHKVVKMQIDENVKIVQTFLSKGADPNLKNNKGLTAVQLAAIKYNTALLRIFKEHGGDFNVLTDSGESLILLAYKDSWNSTGPAVKIAETIKFLMSQGCDVNIKDKNGCSPMHYATCYIESVEYLIKHGADVNCPTKIEQQTPLHWATMGLKPVKQGRYGSTAEVVLALLNAGAYWDAVDYKGQTPLHYVLQNDNEHQFKCFLKFGADINDHFISNFIAKKSKKLLIIALGHAIVLKAAGFSIAKVYESYLNKMPRLHRIGGTIEKCTEEVNKLKAYKITSDVSIYQFLHINSRRQFAVVESRVEHLTTSLKSKFPRYHNLIEITCRDAIRRNQLIEPAKVAFCQVTKTDFPDICVELIFHFLTNWSLTALIDAAELC